MASGEHPGWTGCCAGSPIKRRGDERDEARQLRLESDEGLVKVVTLHKSKGLEYPLVFYPFPWSYFKLPKRPPPAFFHAPEDKTACLDLGSDDEATHRALERRSSLPSACACSTSALPGGQALRALLGKGKRDPRLGTGLLAAPGSGSDVPGEPNESVVGRGHPQRFAEAGAAGAGYDRGSGPARTRGARWTGAPVDRIGWRPGSSTRTIDAGWRVASYSGSGTGRGHRAPGLRSARPSRTRRIRMPYPRSSPCSSCLPEPIPGTYCSGSGGAGLSNREGRDLDRSRPRTFWSAMAG